MPQITLNEKDLNKMLKILTDHPNANLFLAKDDGAYVGVAGGSKEADNFENHVVYFRGCNPKKDADWWDECYWKFGGDDFGENLKSQIPWFMKFASNQSVTDKKVIVNVTEKHITMKGTYRQRPIETVGDVDRTPTMGS